MKKLMTLSFAVFLSMAAYSQESSISTAWDFLNSYQIELSNGNEQAAIDNLLAAKKEIDPVTSNPSTMGKSKAWKRKGEIYYFIFADQSPRLTLVKEGAVDTAIHCFYMAVTVEKKDNGQPKIEDKSGVIAFLSSIADTCFKIAGINYDNNEMDLYMVNLVRSQKAYEAFLLADPKNDGAAKNLETVNLNLMGAAFNSGKQEMIDKYVIPMITNNTAPADAYRYLAQWYQDKKDIPKAEETVNKGKERFPNEKSIALAEISLAFEKGEADKAGQLIEAAKKNFPNDKADFILAELNFNLLKGNNDAAIKALDEAINTYKDNKPMLTVLYFNTGVTYSQMYAKEEESEKPDTALLSLYNTKMFEYYSKTVELDPTYHQAYNGMANYYIIRGQQFFKIADNMPLDKQKEYDEYIAKSRAEYMLAIDLMEKAWALDKSPSYKRTLIALYENTKQYDKKTELEKQ